MSEQIQETVKLTLQIAAGCSACGVPVFAGVYHKCGQPYRQGGPDGPVVHVVAVLPASAANIAAGSGMAAPPQVSATENRTHCNACGAELDPRQFHKCAGNSA